MNFGNMLNMLLSFLSSSCGVTSGLFLPAEFLERRNNIFLSTTCSRSWDLVAHPVTQVIGEQALVDILDLPEVAWTC